MEFTGADQEQVAKMQRAVAETLRPFRDKTEAALAVAALLRCARTLIRLYPAERAKALAEGAAMYLQGESPDEGVIIPFGKVN